MNSVPRGQAPRWLDVSRETLLRLDAFLALVEKWNPAINLVAKGSLPEAWNRHVLDSAQIVSLCPADARSWVDFGSGGGFPGLVVACIAQETQPGLSITLVEADKRKAAFLMQAARELKLEVAVIAERAETLTPFGADVISARAFARLAVVCALAERHLAPAGTAIFPKGAQAESELIDAQKVWRFDALVTLSLTDLSGRILSLKNVRHV